MARPWFVVVRHLKDFIDLLVLRFLSNFFTKCAILFSDGRLTGEFLHEIELLLSLVAP
jgi:hypothetical protein